CALRASTSTLQPACAREERLSAVLVGLARPLITRALEHQRIMRACGAVSSLALFGLGTSVLLLPERARPVVIVETHELRDINMRERVVAFDLEHVLVVAVLGGSAAIR